jgi:hypothetical protein
LDNLLHAHVPVTRVPVLAEQHQRCTTVSKYMTQLPLSMPSIKSMSHAQVSGMEEGVPEKIPFPTPDSVFDVLLQHRQHYM